MMSSFRASAMRITLGPSRPLQPLRERLQHRVALLRRVRPQVQQLRTAAPTARDRSACPLHSPLSRFTGATPASAATCSRVSVPNSGMSANSVRLTTGPIPGIDCNSSSFAFHAGLDSIACPAPRPPSRAPSPTPAGSPRCSDGPPGR